MCGWDFICNLTAIFSQILLFMITKYTTTAACHSGTNFTCFKKADRCLLLFRSLMQLGSENIDIFDIRKMRKSQSNGCKTYLFRVLFDIIVSATPIVSNFQLQPFSELLFLKKEMFCQLVCTNIIPLHSCHVNSSPIFLDDYSKMKKKLSTAYRTAQKTDKWIRHLDFCISFSFHSIFVHTNNFFFVSAFHFTLRAMDR